MIDEPHEWTITSGGCIGILRGGFTFDKMTAQKTKKKEKGYHQFSLNHFSCKFRSRTPKTSKYKSRQFLLFALWETHSLKGGFD